MLLEYELQLERYVLAMQPELVITKKEETPLFGALSRLKLKEPIQYIIGKAHFMEMEFSVNTDVLIPRPETEEFVRWIVEEVRNTKYEAQSSKALKILDIGTGSGCIAVSLAKNFSEAQVFALDVSKKALVLAKENAILNEVEVTFLWKDILASGLELEFDIIVSNPPYVRELEKKEMHKNVLEYEPDLALFVSDENPLLFYEKITDFASKNLTDGGALFFEINQYLGKETEQLLRDHNFSEIELRKDMFGNDRMLKGVFK